MRDQIKALAPKLEANEAAAALDAIIGALLGTRETRLSAPSAKARASGAPFDPRRVEMFERLHDALRRFPPEPVRLFQPHWQAAVNQAFF